MGWFTEGHWRAEGSEMCLPPIPICGAAGGEAPAERAPPPDKKAKAVNMTPVRRFLPVQSC